MVVNEIGLDISLYASLVASVLLVFASIAMIARKRTNIAYQKASSINGTHTLQGWIDTCIYSAFLLAGITFFVFSTLLLADAPMIWRQWINRSLFWLFPLLSFIVLCMIWRSENKQIVIEIAKERADKETEKILAQVAEQDRLRTLQAAHDSWRDMADTAVSNLQIVADRAKVARGESLTPIANVVPEHSSPVTIEQQITADIATLRAQLVKVTLELDLPARTSD